MRNFTQSWQTNWSKKLNKYVPVLAIVVVFGGLGTTFLLTSHAATPTASVESENGTISSAASNVTDSTTSGGHAVKFGSGSSGSTGSSCTGFPDASCTGVPTGTTLTAWTGSYTISSCQTISGKIFSQPVTITASNGSSDLNNPCVTIKNSKFTDSITTGSYPNTNFGPTLLQDVEVDMGTNADPSAIFGDNVKLVRGNVHGGKANLQCADGNCEVDDSFMHGPYLVGAYHYDVVGANSVDGFVIRHNTLQCQFTGGSGTGGCSADLGFFGDFGPISNVTVDNNLFKASSDPGYCLITNANKPGKAYPTGDHLVYTNNVFERGSNGNCGQYGPVDNWATGNGNVWTGNKWDDGTALNE